MPYALNQDHVARAFASGQITAGAPPVAMQVVQVGNLVVTSQSVGACDPFVQYGATPFTQKLPNGRHPVALAIANYGDDERIAFARVQFSTQPPVSWRMAVTSAAKDPSTLGPNEYFGYGVDSGTGCFMDAVAAKLFAGRIAQEEGFVDAMMEEMQETYEHTRSWLDVRPNAERDENIICFSTGWGDGSYPSFFGLDAGGNVCQLVTDFRLF